MPDKEAKYKDRKSDEGRTEEGTTQDTAQDVPQEAQDLVVFVQSVMEQMQSRFNQMSDVIMDRVDEMSSRLDGLEKSVQELMVQAEIEPPEDASIEDDPAAPRASPAPANLAGLSATDS